MGGADGSRHCCSHCGVLVVDGTQHIVWARAVLCGMAKWVGSCLNRVINDVSAPPALCPFFTSMTDIPCASLHVREMPIASF
jgi:hypothetical protein